LLITSSLNVDYHFDECVVYGILRMVYAQYFKSFLWQNQRSIFDIGA
jgi:hypothetical protein